MCVASFHTAAHNVDQDHEDHDHDEQQACYAFHLVAQTLATAPVDGPSDIKSPDVLTDRVSFPVSFVSRPMADYRTLAIGPPLQFFAA